MNPEFSTKWSKDDIIRDDGDIGKLSIKGNAITFHIDGYGDVFARNFVGYDNNGMHYFKVYTYGRSNADKTGYFYRVSKVFLYNGDYTEFTGDFITGIKSFSFEIPGLSNWLDIKSVDFGFLEDRSLIIHEVPTPTIVLKRTDPYIYIEYEVKDVLEIYDNNQRAIKKIPRIYVVFPDSVDDRKVVDTITIITRFFSLLVGRMSIAEDIRLDLEGKDMKMWLFLNMDFSVHDSWNAYWMRSRYKFEEVNEFLLQWFEKWYSFSCNEPYEILQEAYFHICGKKTFYIEDMFLTYCRFIEGYDLRKSHDEEISQELERDILFALSEDNFIKTISPYFIKASSRYRPKNAAQWISAGFLGRIGLDSRIKRLDEEHFSFIEVNRERICKGIGANKIYGKISKTRNYYAHYKADKTGILELGEMYNALPHMEMLILSVLMSEMGIDTETRRNAFVYDEAFWMYATHLRPAAENSNKEL